jgi:uncharacterized protein YjbI with pentapeptide repeats
VIEDLDLSGAKDITRARLSSVTFTRVVFKGAQLQVSLRLHSACAAPPLLHDATSLQDMNFSGCSVIDSDFDGCDLTGSCFEGADCSGSRFVGAVLDKVRWCGANMSHTVWRAGDAVGRGGARAGAAVEDAEVGGGGGSSSSSDHGDSAPKHPLLVSGTDISGCILDGCDFSSSSIIDFNFRGVSLQRCSFKRCSLTLVVLSHSTIIGCDFSSARCQCARFISRFVT